jgi:hypothetical protein
VEAMARGHRLRAGTAASRPADRSTHQAALCFLRAL